MNLDIVLSVLKRISRIMLGMAEAVTLATIERQTAAAAGLASAASDDRDSINPDENDVDDCENGDPEISRRGGRDPGMVGREALVLMDHKHGIALRREIHPGAEPREPGALDDEPLTMDDDAPTTPTGPAGGELDRKDRMYKKGPWNIPEMLILQSAKKEDVVRAGKGAPRDKHRTAQEKWQSIEDYCWAHFVQRSAQQCQDKWESMSAEFKKVKDYECGMLTGQKSYFQMTIDERKGFRVPPNFQREVFQALWEWYDKNRIIEPGQCM